MKTIIRAQGTTRWSAAASQALVGLASAGRERHEIWRFLSVQDLRARFRRSRLGILWMILQQLAFTIGAGVVWAFIFQLRPESFIPFLAMGFAIWGMIAVSFTDSCATFPNAQGYIKQSSVPAQVYIWRNAATQAFSAAVGVLTALAVSLALKGLPSPTALLLFGIGLLMVAVTLFFASATMAYLGAIFRDLQHALAGVFQFLFVVSPVIYPPEVLRTRGLDWILTYNPFAALLDIARTPLVSGTAAAPESYAVVAAMCAFFVAAYVAAHARVSSRLVYYV